MVKLAVIGAGAVGRALGGGWSRAGHAVAYGVQDPGSPRHADLAGLARICANAEAAGDAEVVVLATPWDAVAPALASCGPLAGKTVLDATNPLRLGPEGLELAVGFDDSGGETVARLARGAAVFKTMNQVGFAVMADATGYVARPVMFVAGDDAARKPLAMALVGDLGFEPVDAGPLRQARLLEPYAMLWIDQAVNRGAPPDNAFAFLRRGAGT